MIINVRGIHGAGKSTAVRTVLGQLRGTAIYGVLGFKKPEAYCCSLGKKEILYILGPYDSPATTGLDVMTPKGIDLAIKCCERYVQRGHLLFESVLISTRFLEPSFGAWLLQHKKDVVNLTLTTTYDECVAAVLGRQKKSVVAGRGPAKHMNVQRADIERVTKKLVGLGFRMEYASREEAPKKILELLGAIPRLCAQSGSQGKSFHVR